MELQIAVEKIGNVQVTPDYWDCECLKNYIHSKHDHECRECGYRYDEQPDSHVNELIKHRQALGLSN